ncbi:MAG: serine hydrolase domain-containing protein [Acidobacteriota bacterium]
MKRLIGRATILLFLSAAQATFAADPKDRYQEILDTFLAENPQAPGVAATILSPSRGLDWSGAAGKEAKGDSPALTPRHTFRIASNTKTYVAASVLRLSEMGRLNLDDRLGDHLTPAQRDLLRSDGYDVDAITLAQVLSHTAGFGDHTKDPRFEQRILADPQYAWTPEEQLRLLVEWRDPVGKPGEKYAYSDSGYVLLGSLLERWTGRRLGPAVRDLLRFDRLGLQATHWEYMEPTPPEAGPRAHQYLGPTDVTAFRASFDLFGGGGIVTDTRELTAFVRRLLTVGVLDRPATLHEMTGRGTLPYRLGLMVVECDGWIAYGHQGFWNTFAFHVPSLDLTVGGTILNHDAANGRVLLRRLVAAVAASGPGTKPRRPSESPPGGSTDPRPRG